MMGSGITRRGFLQRSAAATAVGWSVAGTSLGSTAPSERIHLGFIGLGAMGRRHLNRLLDHGSVRAVAGCDPDFRRREAAQDFAARRGTSFPTCADFREMLAMHPDIDAVFVAAPDHWHAPAAIHCMQAGIDVYCEAPLTRTLYEGIRMVETARSTGRVVQMGATLRMDSSQFRMAAEAVREGHIGPLHKIICFFGANPVAAPIPHEASPRHLDWDLYLGPVPWRPFNRLIHPYNFRYFKDFSGGLIADWGVQLFETALWAMDARKSGPARIEGACTYACDNMYDVPRTCHVSYEFGPAVLEWRQGGDPIEPGHGYGIRFLGSDGEVFANRAVCRFRDRRGREDHRMLSARAVAQASACEPYDSFFRAVRERSQSSCCVDAGHRATSLAHLGNIAMALERPLNYDAYEQRFPGDAEANAVLRRPMCEPWNV